MVREMDFVDEYYAGKDLSLLKKLTIVIPTYNRNYYLSRCLWYHAHFPFGQIIVADSSPEEKKIVNRETVAKIREMFGVDVLYLEYEPETEKYGGDIYRKWGDAVQHVDTEYSQFVTDKEFIIPETVTALIQYLDMNPDYALADGCHYGIEQTSDFKYEYVTHPINTRAEEDSLDRFLQTTEYPTATILSIQRTKIVKQEYDALIRYDIGDIRYGEIFVELQSIILGKLMADENNVISYRDLIALEKKGIASKQKESSSFRYPQLWEYGDTEKSKYYCCFKKGIVERLNETTLKQEKMDVNTIDLALQKYISKKSVSAHPLRKSEFIKKMFYLLPKKIQRLILVTIMDGTNGPSDFRPKELIITDDVAVIIKMISYTEMKISGSLPR